MTNSKNATCAGKSSKGPVSYTHLDVYKRQVKHRWPMSWLYRREGERLLAFERSVAQQVSHCFFVTENETELFCNSAPECKGRVEAMCNGVDLSLIHI